MTADQAAANEIGSLSQSNAFVYELKISPGTPVAFFIYG
jgi:hypothetical protein